MTLLLDITDIPTEQCNDCIEDLFKALAEDFDGGADKSIWARHENPYIADLVEDVTARFQALLMDLQDAFSAMLTGKPIGDLKKAEDIPDPWQRWDQVQIDDVRAYLDGKPHEEWTLDDWMLSSDLLVQSILPTGVIKRQAEYLTVRAQILGKVQANIAARAIRQPTSATISEIAKLVPTTFAAVPARVLTPIERAILTVAQARATENITSIADSARHRMKTVIIEHTQAAVLGQAEGTGGSLRTRLHDEFGQLNRDLRRIAITEAGESCNNGFVAAQANGARVVRMEAYRGACPFCQQINGREFEIVSPSAPEKDGETQIWVGKNNIGRSAAPRKRLGGTLVPRESAEMWWPAAGVQHPHCRGGWSPGRSPTPPNVDPEFDKWMQAKLATTLPKPPKERAKS